MTRNGDEMSGSLAGRRRPAQVGRNFRALAVGEATNKMLRFVAAAVLARGLTAEEYGLFNVGIAVSGLLVVATTFGLPEIGAREIARTPERATWLAGRIVSVRVSMTGSVLMVGLAVVVLVQPEWFGYSVATAAVALAMATNAEWLARGLERMSLFAVAFAVGGGVSLLGAGIVAAASGSASAALLTFAVAECVTAVLTWTAARSTGRPELGLSGARPILVEGWPVALSAMAVYAYYANVDTIILAATRSEAEAGLYSGAYRLFLAFNVAAVFAAYANFPRLSRIGAEIDPRQLAAELAPTLRLLASYSLGVLGVALLAGDWVLGTLFGDAFRDASDAFTLLCVASLWYCVGYPVGYSLIALGRTRRFLAGALTAGVLTLSLDAALIPGSGMTGAAAATAISIVIAVVIWLRADIGLTRGVAPAVVAAGLASLVAVVGLLTPAFATGAGAVFVGLAVAGGAWTMRSRTVTAAR